VVEQIGLNFKPFYRCNEQPGKFAVLGIHTSAFGFVEHVPIGDSHRAQLGDGAVIDHQFGTTDVFIIMPVEAIKSRYFAHFGSPDELSAPIAQEFAPLN